MLTENQIAYAQLMAFAVQVEAETLIKDLCVGGPEGLYAVQVLTDNNELLDLGKASLADIMSSCYVGRHGESPYEGIPGPLCLCTYCAQCGNDVTIELCSKPANAVLTIAFSL